MRKNIAVVAALLSVSLVGCVERNAGEPVAASGATKANVQVQTDPDGLTTEQRNIRDRLAEDNKPGAIKHLYVVSPYSGQVIIYSTVRGKVTSGGKRLSPVTVTGPGQYYGDYFVVNIGNEIHRTAEVLQDDGTYGHSDSYLYWWDTKGVYHQHYVSGGQIIHVSDQPLPIRSVIINMELTSSTKETVTP